MMETVNIVHSLHRQVDFEDVQEVGPENHDDQENPRQAGNPEVTGFAMEQMTTDEMEGR